ncbi:hypothetical protein HA402_000393 [Bradysia odoriphaga]|nr:hypothetical protein HA402_000393 [Bradysia odoriphaga]
MNQQPMNQQQISNYNEILIFQDEKHAWEQAIESYEGNVPLDLWFNYVCWYEQKMSLDTENKYQWALSKCLATFESNENYKQDIRMVKLWMKYINLQPNPLNMYQRLYERGVGTQWAIFYIGWAHYYDIANEFNQAESVYNLGFQAKAKPTADLEEAHAKFRRSLSQRMNKDNNLIKKRTVDQMVDQRQMIESNSAAAKRAKLDEDKQESTASNYISSAANSDPYNLNNSASVITTSLNSVYGDAYDCDDQDSYDSLGINIPPNFVRVARNNHESWTGALCLDEPYEPNKVCKYRKDLVYTGSATEYSPEEIRARRFSQLINVCRERNRCWEMEQAMKREEKARIEAERHRIEQERLRQAELERLRQQAEQERLRIAAEQERARAAEYERIRLAEIERQAVAERQRQQQQQQAQEFRRQQLLEQQELARKAECERMRFSETSYSANGYNIQNTVSSNAASDDIEEQIEASTIRFSTGNGLSSKPKTITIKYRREKPSISGDFNSPKVPSPTASPHVKPKKERKRKSKKLAELTESPANGNGQNKANYYGQTSNHYDNKYHEMTAPHSNNIDDANLLLNIANIHSSSNDDSSYSYSSNCAVPVQSSYLTNDDSFSNSDYPSSYPYSAENSNGTYPYSNSSTPIRNVGRNYMNDSISKSSTPHNFRILKKRTSDVSYQNDDSMCSISGEQNSFFAAENSEELKQKRLEKALSTIETHLAKSNLDPFNSELCKAFLVKKDFPSRDHDDMYKLVSTPISKLLNTKIALLANIPFQIEKEVGRGSYGSVFKAINTNTGAVVALKYQKPPNNWELYICREVRKKITNYDMLLGFMDISTAIVGPNASIFVTEFSPYGSLLDINNRIRQATTKVMHESLVMHFASQILAIVNQLHSCKIIHADIKPDNFLLMKIPDPTSHLPTIRLIDFGCAIDMNFFDDKTQFKKRIETDGFTCTEMQDGRSWSYQTDIFCIAGTIHVMLFGEYMQTFKKFGQWEIKSKLPRYLKKHVWSDLFTKFLNIKDVNHLPNLIDFKARIDDELYNMESDLQSQIRTLKNVLHGR